jgi:hypothetical protein
MAPRKAPAGQAALRKRQHERADLQGQKIIWIGIAATEANIQRIGTLLLLADHPAIEEPYVDQLAGIIPDEPPPLDVDYEVVKSSIAKHLQEYVKRFDEERARAVLNSFGASRLSSIVESQLLPLHAALEAAQQAEPK